MNNTYLIASIILLVCAILFSKYEYFTTIDPSQWRCVNGGGTDYSILRFKNNKVECYNDSNDLLCKKMNQTECNTKKSTIISTYTNLQNICACELYDMPGNYCSNFLKDTQMTKAQTNCISAFNAGTTTGSTAGTTAGITTGTTVGTTAGITTGTTAGITTGSTAGTTTGTTAGTTTGSTAGTTQGTTTATQNKLVDVSDNDWKSQFNGMQFLKDIRSVVRDEIIANNIATANTTKAAIENKVAQEVQTPSIMQGKAFSNPAYDMNQYIRKDSIPCYACTLDY
jgi:hypothetical protein